MYSAHWPGFSKTFDLNYPKYDYTGNNWCNLADFPRFPTLCVKLRLPMLPQGTLTRDTVPHLWTPPGSLILELKPFFNKDVNAPICSNLAAFLIRRHWFGAVLSCEVKSS